MHNRTMDKGRGQILSRISHETGRPRGIGMTIDPWTHRPVQQAVPYRVQNWVPADVKVVRGAHGIGLRRGSSTRALQAALKKRARAAKKANRVLLTKGRMPISGPGESTVASCSDVKVGGACKTLTNKDGVWKATGPGKCVCLSWKI